MKMLRAILVAAGLAALTACGGGAPTVVNPNTNPPAVNDYAGPPPKDADTQAFRIAFWQNVKANNRCGGCHNASTPGQAPRFARNDDVNLAYAEALPYVNTLQPDQSLIVTRVAEGHNCWLSSPQACADILTGWIQRWLGGAGGEGTQIVLVAPADAPVGASKTFPAEPDLFAATVWPVLTANCSRCHSPNAISPAPGNFGSADVVEAYAAARPKINLDEPADSRFVERLRDEGHNCWIPPNGDCPQSSAIMLDAIRAFANQVPVTDVDPALKVSRALRLIDGTVASGGNRFDEYAIAKYEFKELKDGEIFDTSGVEPALNLTVAGDVEHVGGWGISIGSGGGKAQAQVAASRKLADRIKATGEFSIEVWAAPADVTQEDAYIVSYSGGAMARNFTLAQRVDRYEALVRSSTTGANGAPALLTRDGDKDVQASLQHVVMTYDPVNGRRLFVNGVFTGDADPRDGGTLADWDDTFTLVFGNETSNNRQWRGVLRLVAIHERALTEEQIQMNFAAGVGERYFLLFNVTELTGVPQSYIMFDASVYDSYSYLFTRPTFISLDPSVEPGSIPVKGIRIGVNGAEAQAGQAFANLDITVNDASYSPESGQRLSELGTVIGLQKGPEFDQFFLTFDRIADQTYARTAPAAAIPIPADLDPRPDIGVRTFEQLNQSMSQVTGVPTTNTQVRSTYLQVQQQLPPVPDIEAFLASHQTGVAQLAIKYCSVMVDNASTRSEFFPQLDTGMSAASQFSSAQGKEVLIGPLLEKVVGINIATQPEQEEVREELALLIDRLVANGASSANVAKAACAAALGSGVLSIL
jgi:mono/diheme cytochrome c family protein